MKINEVEQAVGITRKNIRFYEEQGLLKPGPPMATGSTQRKICRFF